MSIIRHARSQSFKYIDINYKSLLTHINKHIQNLSKHQQIRIDAWIKKLQKTNSANFIWKQNRNFYAQVLLEMLKQNKILEPFNKFPQQGALKKLTPLDVPYPFRDRFLERKQQKSQNRTNRNYHQRIQSYNTNKIPINLQNMQINVSHNNKKSQRRQSLTLTSFKTNSFYKRKSANNSLNTSAYRTQRIEQQLQQVNQSSPDLNQKEQKVIQQLQRMKQNENDSRNLSVINFTTALANESKTISKPLLHKLDSQQIKIYNCQCLSQIITQYQTGKTSRNKHKRNFSQHQMEQLSKYQKKENVQLLKRVLKFLGKNYELLQNQNQYKNLLKDIISFGQKYKQNKYIEPQLETFRSYSKQIRKKFEKTGMASKQFLNYLNSIKKQL